MNPVLRKHLEESQRAHNITFDVVKDWDALQDLARLADVVMQSETAAEKAMVRPCVTIGNATFHRLTIGASAWVDRVTKDFGVSDTAWIVVIAFAMAHAKTPREKLWPLFADKATVQTAIDEWANGLGVDFGALQDGLLSFMEEGRADAVGEGEADTEGERKTGFGRLVDVLCHDYGETPEHWLWDVPLCDIEALMAARARRLAAENKGAKSDPNDPRIQASHKLFVGVRELAQKVKGR